MRRSSTIQSSAASSSSQPSQAPRSARHQSPVAAAARSRADVTPPPPLSNQTPRNSRHHHHHHHHHHGDGGTSSSHHNHTNEEEDDELAYLAAISPSNYASDLHQWGSHLVRLCADGATARPFPFLLDFEHAEPPPLFDHLVYHLPSERRHGVDRCLRRMGTVHLACAELHDPRDDFLSEEEANAKLQRDNKLLKKEQQEQEQEQIRKSSVASAGTGGGRSNAVSESGGGGVPSNLSEHSSSNIAFIDQPESSDAGSGGGRRSPKQQEGNDDDDHHDQEALPTGGFMLHATMFLQLRIPNHTYYLAPVDQAHREAVKRSIRRWIASARGPIASETGNLLLRYAITIPRPAVRKQLQKIVDRARKESMPAHTAAAHQQQQQAQMARSRVGAAPGSPVNATTTTTPATSATGGESADCTTPTPTKSAAAALADRPDLPSVDPSIAAGDEPHGTGTDGVSAAQFAFRDAFLCSVVERKPNSHHHQHRHSHYQQHNAAADEGSSDEDDIISNQQQQNQQQSVNNDDPKSSSSGPSPTMSARVEHAPPLVTVEQELVHGITLRDHQTCCCPHRTGLPSLIEEGWWSSAQTGLLQAAQMQQNNNSNNNSSDVSGSPSRRVSEANSLMLPGGRRGTNHTSAPPPPVVPDLAIPKLEEQTIHGAMQIPHPFGRNLSFQACIKHKQFGELHCLHAGGVLEPLFAAGGVLGAGGAGGRRYSTCSSGGGGGGSRRQNDVTMESSFQFQKSQFGASVASTALLSGSPGGGSPATSNRRASTLGGMSQQQPQHHASSSSSSSGPLSPCTVFVSQLMTACTTSDNALLVLLVSLDRDSNRHHHHHRGGGGASSASGGGAASAASIHIHAHDRVRVIGWARIWIEPVLHPSVTVALSITNMFRKHFYPCDPMLRLQRKNARELAHCPVGTVLPPSSWMTPDDEKDDDCGDGGDAGHNRYLPRPPPATKLLHQTETVFLSEAYHNRSSALFRYCDMRLPSSCVSCEEGKPVGCVDAVPRILAAWRAREKEWLSRRVKTELLSDEARLALLEEQYYGAKAQEEDLGPSKEQVAEEEKKRRKKQLGAFVFIGTSSSDDDEQQQNEQQNKNNNSSSKERRGSVGAGSSTSGTAARLGFTGRTAIHRTEADSKRLLTQIENLVAKQQGDSRIMISSIFPYAMLLPVKSFDRKKAMSRSYYWRLVAIRPHRTSDTGGGDSLIEEEQQQQQQKQHEGAPSRSLLTASSPRTPSRPGSAPNSRNSPAPRFGATAASSSQQQLVQKKEQPRRFDSSTVYALVEDEFVVEVLDLLFDHTDGSTKPSVVGTSVFSLQKVIDAFSSAEQQEAMHAAMGENKMMTISLALEERESSAASPSASLPSQQQQQQQQQQSPLLQVRWHRDVDIPDDVDLLTAPKMLELPFERRTAFDDLHSRLRTSLDSGKGLTRHFVDRLISFHPTTLRQDQSQVSRRFLQERRERFRRTSVNVGIVGKESAQDSFARLFDTHRSEDNSRGVWDVGAMFVVDFCAGSGAAHNRRVFLDGSNMVRGVLRHVALQLAPFTGWCELAACSTNSSDRQLSLQTLLRYDDFSMSNPFVDGVPFVNPCVDPVYEAPRGVSDLLKAYDTRCTAGQQSRRGSRFARSGSVAAGGGGAAAASSNPFSDLPAGMQMPFFLTPTLRHARRVARARAEAEMEMDRAEEERLARKQQQQQQHPGTSAGIDNAKLCTDASEWFGDVGVTIQVGDGGDSEAAVHDDDGGPVPSRRRFFVVTVIVTGADIADAKNAAQLLDEMQSEPVVLFLVVLKKHTTSKHSSSSSSAAAGPSSPASAAPSSTAAPLSPTSPFSPNSTFSGTQTTATIGGRKRAVAFTDDFSSSSATQQQQQQQQQQREFSDPNARFESQLREFRNRWNVIISVLDSGGGDPGELHESFDRLAIATREIPRVFVSCARCLSHGPKGLRPTVTRASPLMVQARRKQQEEKKRQELQQHQHQQKLDKEQKEREEEEEEEKQRVLVEQQQQAAAEVEASASDQNEEQQNALDGDDQQDDDGTNTTPGRTKQQRYESAIRSRMRIIGSDPSLEPSLAALRTAIDGSYTIFPGLQKQYDRAQERIDASRQGTPAPGNRNRSPTPPKSNKKKDQKKRRSRRRLGNTDQQQQQSAPLAVATAFDATRGSVPRRDLLKRKTDEDLKREEDERIAREARRARRKRRALGQASWEAGDFDDDEALDSGADEEEEAAERQKVKEREARRTRRRRLLARGIDPDSAEAEKIVLFSDDDDDGEQNEEEEEEEDEDNVTATVTEKGPNGVAHIAFHISGFSATGSVASDSEDEEEAEEEEEEESADEEEAESLPEHDAAAAGSEENATDEAAAVTNNEEESPAPATTANDDDEQQQQQEQNKKKGRRLHFEDLPSPKAEVGETYNIAVMLENDGEPMSDAKDVTVKIDIEPPHSSYADELDAWIMEGGITGVAEPVEVSFGEGLFVLVITKPAPCSSIVMRASIVSGVEEEVEPAEVVMKVACDAASAEAGADDSNPPAEDALAATAVPSAVTEEEEKEKQPGEEVKAADVKAPKRAAGEKKRSSSGGKKRSHKKLQQQQRQHQEQQAAFDPSAHALCDTSVTLVDVFLENLSQSDEDD